MGAVFKWSGRLSGALAALTKILLALVVILVVVDITLRNVSRPLAWSTSVVEYILIYVAFLSAPALVRGKGHVCADFLRSAIPAGPRRIIEKLVYAVCIALCLYLGALACTSALDSLRSGSYDVRTFDLPKWVIFLPMMLGLWLSALEFLRYLLGHDSIYAVAPTEIEGF